MRALYLSCHRYLEKDELKLFSELGLDIVGSDFNLENINKHGLDNFDVIISMWMPTWLTQNWDLIKNKIVIMRSIGQSTASEELKMKVLKEKGMKIVRYSPMEKNIPNYCGEDAMIRFYKDKNEWCGWNGQNKQVVNVTQSILKRKDFCGYQILLDATDGFPRKVYGHGNEDIGDLWGGELSDDEIKNVYRDNRVYFYTGTQPASYTLNFIEAMMTGIPIVAIGSKLGNPFFDPNQNTYEITNIIQRGVNGYFSDDIEELKHFLKKYLDDFDEAKHISEQGRKTAIELFGKEKIKSEWKEFFEHNGIL